MTIEKKLLATNPVSGEVLPEAVSFDGTNDNLIKSSDLTNNINSKTFTFSAWFYVTAEDSGQHMYLYDSYYNSGMYVQFDGNRKVQCLGVAQGGTGNGYLSIESPINVFVAETWQHIIISVDMANTSNRYVYINDQSISVTWNSYSNAEIGFAQTVHAIGTNSPTGGAGTRSKSRLAHVFLDYTYRDLSTTSNRRLFIDADGKPSSTIPSSPVLYLPMKDAATAGSNSGTGGDFTAVGVLATAERGPNQDNCSASTFTGSADYLSRSLMSGASDSKTFTYAGVIRTATAGNNSFFEMYNTSTSAISYMTVSSVLRVVMQDATGAVLTFSYSNVQKDQSLALAFSVDLTDANKRHVVINGVDVTSLINWSVYINRTIPFSTYPVRVGGDTAAFGYLTGSVGETYFNTVYTDLSADNPFWDSDTNRPNSVRKVIADTSVTPLIALPIIGNDAGNNLGSGGDFTVNSGPYTGARGGSEFWSRSAYFNGSSTDLTNTSLTGLSTGKQFTIAFGYSNFSYSDDVTIFEVGGGSGAGAGVYSKVFFTSSEVKIKCGNGSADHLEISLGRGATSGIIMISCDTSSAVDAIDFVIDGTYSDRSSGIIVQNSNITDSSENDSIIGNRLADNQTFNGSLGFIYVDDSYIDFSQEANRNKFVDQLGYPRDLTQQIEDGDISNPLIYMKFENTAALGTNSGSGGNFTVNGTVTAGADVTP